MDIKGKTNIAKSLNLRKTIALLLAFLFTASTFFIPVNLAYADDNGEMVLKTIKHSEALREALIQDEKVTLTLPYGYAAETIELSDITYTYDSKFKDIEIVFPSGSVATVDGPSVIMDVSYSYVEEAGATATIEETTVEEETAAEEIAVKEETAIQYSTSYYIYVKSGKAPSFSGTVSLTATLQKKIAIGFSDFNNLYKNNDGKGMKSISISAPSKDSIGTLKLNGSDYVAGTLISVDDIKSGKLEFVPLSTGAVTYTVTAYANDEDETNCGNVSLNIKVETPVANNIAYSSKQYEFITFKLSDFTNACTKTVGGTLDYIVIPNLPSSTYGKLYIDYVAPDDIGSSVTAGNKYITTRISRMSFMPNGGYFGTFNISYEGYNTDGAMFTGKIEITFIENPIDADTIKYSTYTDVPVNFEADDFAVECKDTTGRTLDYVKFTLPSSTKGKLYLNYKTSSEAKISETTKYYKSDLNNITFVPYTGFTGTVVISYVGYNDAKKSYTGEVEIKVEKINTDADPIVYKTGSYTPLVFDSSDFTIECRDTTGKALDYIKFTIPSSTYGVMYMNYTSPTKYGSKVSSSTKYYKTDLDDITFVPKASFSGVVMVSYTGYNTSGTSYTGVVKITVNKEVPVASNIKISTKENTPILLTEKNFNDASKNTTGGKLDYVKFTLPASKYGKLYYKYTSETKFDSAVSANTKYYYDSTPLLSNVTFVPYKDYSGTVTVNYTGYDINEDSFTGSIEITVTPIPKTDGSLYFKDVTKDYSWAARQIDYLYEKSVVAGTGNNNYSPAQNMIRGDFMLMLYRALNLSVNTTESNFKDVPKDSYYYKAILTAKALGIAKGYDDSFMPGTGITREDAMVLVDRTLKVQGKKLTAGSSSDLNIFKDTKSVSDYAVTSVATLVKAGIIQGSNGYLNPKSFISRAEMAVIIYRVLDL